MKYCKRVILKNGVEAELRSAAVSDAEAVLDNFNQAHAETDFLLSYPGEKTFTVAEEADFLREKEESPDEVEIAAFIDGRIAGTAGINSVGHREKIQHRAEVGISILQEFWGLGIGRALMEACIECAENAGYSQLELSVVADNQRAYALYEKLGFCEFGRNPRGFRSRTGEYQELVDMRLELKQ